MDVIYQEQVTVIPMIGKQQKYFNGNTCSLLLKIYFFFQKEVVRQVIAANILGALIPQKTIIKQRVLKWKKVNSS